MSWLVHAKDKTSLLNANMECMMSTMPDNSATPSVTETWAQSGIGVPLNLDGGCIEPSTFV